MPLCASGVLVVVLPPPDLELGPGGLPMARRALRAMRHAMGMLDGDYRAADGTICTSAGRLTGLGRPRLGWEDMGAAP